MRTGRTFLSILLVLSSFSSFDLEAAINSDWVRAYAFPRGKDRPLGGDRQGIRTNALLLYHDGKLVFEDYHKGFGPETPHLAWSVTKSVLGLLIGIAEKKNYLTRDSLIERKYPELMGRGIKVRDLLHWASGLDWNEGYEFSPIGSKVIEMLFSTGRRDMASFVARRASAKFPGEYSEYSSGDSVLLSGFLWRSLPESERDTFLQKEFFGPLEITSATFERDLAGTPVGSSFLFISSRDLLKIGELVLNQGRWRGRSIVEEEYIRWMGEVAPSFKVESRYETNWLIPGGHWWLNRTWPGQTFRSWPDVPEDLIVAKGHWGQILAIVPSKKFIMLRFADDRDESFDWNLFLGRVLKDL